MVNSNIIKIVLHDKLISRTKTEFLGLSPMVAFCISDVLKVGAVYFFINNIYYKAERYCEQNNEPCVSQALLYPIKLE